MLFKLLGSGDICYSLPSRLANYTSGPKDESRDYHIFSRTLSVGRSLWSAGEMGVGSGWERVINQVRVQLVAEITSNVL